MNVPNWLSVTTVSSSIKITYQANPSDYRTATITVLVNGNTANGFTVKQGTPPPPPPPCTIIKEIGNHDFPTADTAYKDFPFRYSNCVFKPSAYEFTNASGGGALPAWVSVSKVGDAFRATVAENYSGTDREVVIRAVSVIGPSVSTTFRVTQTCIRTWYKDTDGDGYASLKVNRCVRPGNDYVAYEIPLGDCDDNNDALHPDTVWYANKDGDGFAANTVTQCAQPGLGYVLTVLPLGDCDDDNKLIHPNTIWYIDTDDDGFGEAENTVTQCTAPTGYVLNNGDRCPGESGPNDGCIFTNDNYIFTRVYQEEMTSSNDIQNAHDVIESIVYYDGIGRPKQQIAIKGSPNKKDMITHMEYDSYGRQAKQYLPYEANSDTGGLKAIDIDNDINSYYQNTYPEDFTGVSLTDVNAYSESIFEPSPLNRVTEQGAPGTSWKADKTSDTDHTIKYNWNTNSANEVVYFNVTFENGDTQKPQLAQNGYYPANQLFVTITKDENWKPSEGNNRTTKEFTDKLGQVVLKRTYNSGVAHDTYYVYDRFNNLTFVLPPKVDVTDGVSETELAEVCYQYKYDYRNRLIEKKIPGKGWEYIVYNKFDQPIMSQHAGLRKENSGSPADGWFFTKYDAFGRVIYTGLSAEGSNRHILQSRANSNSNEPYETKITTPITIDRIPVYYTKDAYPITSVYQMYTINYYDTYDFDIAGLNNPGTVYGAAVSNRTQSLPTGTKVRVMDTNDWITTVTYYDDKSRPIYVASKNEYLETTDIVENKLDFAGRVLETKTTHIKDGNAAIVTIDSFTYDHMGRLLTQTQQINDQDKEQIVSNVYNKIGQLVSKKVGGIVTASGSTAVSSLQEVNYTYNIRGWLTEINDVENLGNDLFSFAIDYDGGINPLYNGNISKTAWQTANDNITRSYDYTYDALNRITSGTSDNGRYNLSNVTYDKMGNILTLDRKGHLDGNAASFGDMDNLSYIYDNNKLLKVTDTANKDHGFKDGTNTNNDYSYDANGNLLVDHNKNISGIVYNYFNLPTRVNVNGARQYIQYVYDVTGTKLKKIVTEDSSRTTTEYAGNYIYKNGQLEFFNHSEGYIEPVIPTGSTTISTFDYIYQFKDHLGNIRLSYKDVDKDGSITQSEIIEEKNYYPFGLTHEGYNNIMLSEHPYGYNGKEEQNELGLNWIDYGARNYNASLGRWMNIDPIAEVYYGINPYGYVFNNPVQLFDPDGMRVEYVRQEGQSREEFRQARREFKRRNRQLSRESKTHKANFTQLKKSKNTHSISFNKGKGSSVEQVGTKNKETGNDTNISIDLDQKSDGDQGNKFVIAHELVHAVEDDKGTSSPFELKIELDNLSPVRTTFENNAKNREFDEEQAGHVENIIRGEVSVSTGVKVPLRETVEFKVETFFLGKYDQKIESVKVIRKNYKYYENPKN